MTRTLQEAGPIGGSASRAVSPLPLLLCGVILLAAVPWQLRWGVIPDTSWIITMTERVLAGERLYVDIVETNPPFTVWLYLPPVALAGWTGLSPEVAVHLYVYGLCVAGLGGAALVARQAAFAENPALLALLPAFLALLTIFPGNSFSEREHIGVALLLPLLVLAAWRASSDTPHTPSLVSGVLAGLCGAVIVLVKPYYALLIVIAALYVAARRRSLMPLLFPEYLVAAAVCAAYLVVVLRLHPEFLNDVYPVVADTYLRVSLDWTAFSNYFFIFVVWLCLILRLGAGAPTRPLATVLALVSAVAYVPLFYQGKGWPYHAYPAIALGMGALLCHVFASRVSRRLEAVQMLFLLVFMAVASLPYLQTQKPDRDFVATIRDAVEQPVVALIGSDLAAGHPLNRMVGGRWTSVYCSDWLGVFAIYLAMTEELKGNDAEAARYRTMAERLVDEKMAELESARPDLILLQRGDIMWLERLASHPAYGPFMESYRLLTEDRGLEAWVRRDATIDG